ncbi:MAG: hypothetical protein J5661_00395 [Bacteroidaceae bacterium]|nr:hypothetical protein [Bacteroidaceae bacterium]
MFKFQSSIFKVSFLALFLSACSSKPNHEEMGQRMLDEARRELSQKNFAAARDTIMSLRLRCPKALQARRQALVLLDSIEMLGAADSLSRATGPEWERLEVKHKFYQRKLQEDLTQNKFVK